MPDAEAIDAIIRKVAREEILSRYQSLQDHEISGKQSGEIVTEADQTANAGSHRDLTALLPGSAVIGERHMRQILKSLAGLRKRHPYGYWTRWMELVIFQREHRVFASSWRS